jgi:hypothetical protein
MGQMTEDRLAVAGKRNCSSVLRVPMDLKAAGDLWASGQAAPHQIQHRACMAEMA